MTTKITEIIDDVIFKRTEHILKNLKFENRYDDVYIEFQPFVEAYELITYLRMTRDYNNRLMIRWNLEVEKIYNQSLNNFDISIIINNPKCSAFHNKVFGSILLDIQEA